MALKVTWSASNGFSSRSCGSTEQEGPRSLELEQRLRNISLTRRPPSCHAPLTTYDSRLPRPHTKQRPSCLVNRKETRVAPLHLRRRAQENRESEFGSPAPAVR